MSIETQGKSLVDLLDMLEPAPIPAPVSMVPQTWGWVVIGGLVAFVVLAVSYRLLQKHRANAYRRIALEELSVAGDDPAKISLILRRTALAAYPRFEVAGLYGNDWISFLTQNIEKYNLPADSALAIQQAPYANVSADPELTRFARHWIKTHKPSGGL